MATDFAWLIEAPGQHYLAVRKLGGVHEFHWSQDHAKALRFRDQPQADEAMMAIRELNRDLFKFDGVLAPAKPVEHGWG